MSALDPSTPLDEGVLPSPATPARQWLREPLLHFLVLGLLLFAVDHLLFAKPDDAKTVLIDAEVDRQARKVFRDARGREPNNEELYALRRVWLDNEVLYREGLALGVDKGDSAIRERVIFKMLSVVDAGLKPPVADERTLREWFEKHRARYDEPARYDFLEAVLPGAPDEATVRAFVERLNHGAPGDLEAGLRVFKGRPHANIVQSYGEPFARELEGARVGEWRAMRTGDAWRAMRLDAIAPAKPASFEPLRGVVLHDWTDAVMAERRSDAVRALAKKYAVKVDGPAR
jgi:hypothetical protein